MERACWNITNSLSISKYHRHQAFSHSAEHLSRKPVTTMDFRDACLWSAVDRKNANETSTSCQVQTCRIKANYELINMQLWFSTSLLGFLPRGTQPSATRSIACWESLINSKATTISRKNNKKSISMTRNPKYCTLDRCSRASFNNVSFKHTIEWQRMNCIVWKGSFNGQVRASYAITRHQLFTFPSTENELNQRPRKGLNLNSRSHKTGTQWISYRRQWTIINR